MHNFLLIRHRNRYIGFVRAIVMEVLNQKLLDNDGKPSSEQKTYISTKSENPNKQYVGSTSTEFKVRFRNHKSP